jgi:hypothetical protein
LQWRGQLSGKGIKEFGRMIADSGAFFEMHGEAHLFPTLSPRFASLG